LSFNGGDQLILTKLSDASVIYKSIGALGTFIGFIKSSSEKALSPITLIAVTTNFY